MLHFQFIRQYAHVKSVHQMLGFAYADALINDPVYTNDVVRNFTTDYMNRRKADRELLIKGIIWPFLRHVDVVDIDIWKKFVLSVLSLLAQKRKKEAFLSVLSSVMPKMHYESNDFKTKPVIDRIFDVMRFLAEEQMAIGCAFEIDEWYKMFVRTVPFDDMKKVKALFMQYFGFLKGKSIATPPFYIHWKDPMDKIENLRMAMGILYLKDVGITNFHEVMDHVSKNLKNLYRPRGIYRAIRMVWGIHADVTLSSLLKFFIPGEDKKGKYAFGHVYADINWKEIYDNDDACSQIFNSRHTRVLSKSGMHAIVSFDGQYYMIRRVDSDRKTMFYIQPMDKVENPDVTLATAVI